MNPDKDYYRILGVLDDAEDIVIRAAYRALAQRYHPDKWQGDAAEATRRMTEINAAYAVLSDPAKRAAYDGQREKNQFRDESPEEEESQSSADNKDWEIATKYHPDLLRIELILHAISRELAFTFKLMLLENKQFNQSANIASDLEKKYFKKYFGDNPEVQAFAKELILEGRNDAAKELNEVVRVLGSVDSAVIEKIAREFNTERSPQAKAKRAAAREKAERERKAKRDTDENRQKPPDNRPKGKCPVCFALIPLNIPVCPTCHGVIETLWRSR